MSQTSARRDLSGQNIGNLKLIERIGQGGVGVVYRAEHISLGTPYAVKILHPRFARDTTTMERFRREAQATARLRHPNVVFVTDFGFKEQIGIYIIMEYLEGSSLTEVLKREKPMDLERAGRFAIQLCDALEAAHQEGIVHRDLKPDNIHVRSVVGQQDQVKVLDFGIAQLKGQVGLTEAGMTVGSPHYMSPEQVQGLSDQIGPASDIYSLGVLLYQMITGRWPIDAPDLFTLCRLQLTQVPQLASTLRPELAGTWLEALVAQMLEKSPKDRPGSMAEVAANLRQALQELGAVPEDEPGVEADSSSNFGPTVSFSLSDGQIGAFHLIRSLSDTLEGTAAQALIKTLPKLPHLEGGVLRQVFWGPVSVTISTAALDDPAFTRAGQQMVVLFQNSLGETDADTVALVQAMGAMMRGLEQPRLQALLQILQPVMADPFFPRDALPDWARAHSGSGTWRSIPRPRPQMRDTLADEMVDDDAPTNVNSPPEEESLFGKLRQPLSLDNMRAVLTHRIVPRKGDKDE